MKWSDLEPDDVIKITKEACTKGNYASFDWANKNLTISDICLKYYDDRLSYIEIWCENNRYRFNIQLNGCRMYWDDLGIFFEIVKLSGE